MNWIAQAFQTYFERWNLHLPEEALNARATGALREQGWQIQYRFGRDERGEYLDFYAAHRMTNDRHVRIREDGSLEDLPAYLEMVVYPKNATAGQIEEADQEFRRYNARVSELLQSKGFEF